MDILVSTYLGRAVATSRQASGVHVGVGGHLLCVPTSIVLPEYVCNSIKVRGDSRARSREGEKARGEEVCRRYETGARGKKKKSVDFCGSLMLGAGDGGGGEEKRRDSDTSTSSPPLISVDPCAQQCEWWFPSWGLASWRPGTLSACRRWVNLQHTKSPHAPPLNPSVPLPAPIETGVLGLGVGSAPLSVASLGTMSELLHHFHLFLDT